MVAARKDLIEAFLNQISKDRESIKASIDDAHTAATHEETAAKSKWDTFALENSYLANGQVKRLQELDAAYDYLKKLSQPASTDTVQEGHLVVLEDENGKRQQVLLSKLGGGIKAYVSGSTYQVLSLQTPLAKAILGSGLDETAEIQIQGKEIEYQIVKIS